MNQKNKDSNQFSQNLQELEESSQILSLKTNIQDLQKPLKSLKQFIKSLPSEKNQQFQQQIIEYCEKQSILQKIPEQIILLCEKRIQKMMRNKKAKKNWNEDDINLLVWTLNKYTSYYQKKSVHNLDENDWKFISSLIPAVTWKKCMFKWLSLKKFSLLSFRWSNEQSNLLSQLIKQNGKKDWKRLSERLYVQNKNQDKIFRTPKQCRQHWNCYLNPTIKKGPWNKKQDIKLLQSVLELNCMKKWSQIAKNIKGRTENAVKNRFTLLIDKQKKLKGDQTQKQAINRSLVKLIHQEYNAKEIINKSNGLEYLKTDANINDENKQEEKIERKSDDLIANIKIQNEKMDKNQIQAATYLQADRNQQNCLIIPKIVNSNSNNECYLAPNQYMSFGYEFNPFFIGFLYTGRFPMN